MKKSLLIIFYITAIIMLILGILAFLPVTNPILRNFDKNVEVVLSLKMPESQQEIAGGPGSWTG